MLKIPDHQVAGHKAGKGKLGPLVDDSGCFYKPLQDDGRGSHEASFYQSFSSNPSVLDHIRRFFPVFHGVQPVEASDGSGLRSHLVLEDIVYDYSHPCVMDVKIGSRTWYPDASDVYFQKCLKKDRKTTSSKLGFRISGMKIYDDSKFWSPDKKLVQGFSIDDVKLFLRKFVSSNSPADSNSEPDSLLASRVYGGPDGILSQLLELKAWFEDQTFYHFNSCSVLMVYEKESIQEGGNPRARIILVDFAHVIDGAGVIDHNFLGGLCSYIKFISDTLSSETAVPLPDSGETLTCTENGH